MPKRRTSKKTKLKPSVRRKAKKKIADSGQGPVDEIPRGSSATKPPPLVIQADSAQMRIAAQPAKVERGLKGKDFDMVFSPPNEIILRAPGLGHRTHPEDLRRLRAILMTGLGWSKGSHSKAQGPLQEIQELKPGEMQEFGEGEFAGIPIPAGPPGRRLIKVYSALNAELPIWINTPRFDLGMVKPLELQVAGKSVPILPHAYLWPAVFALISANGEPTSIRSLGGRFIADRGYSDALRMYCPDFLKAALDPQSRRGTRLDLELLERKLTANGWI